MINCDFEYYKPESIEEAVSTFNTLKELGKKPMYFAGGTEIISMTRKNLLRPEALIDLKLIKECQLIECDKDTLCYGSMITLNKACEDSRFPLLSDICSTIADHTIRNRLTLGGNICGRLPYKEAVLPFLLIPTTAVIACKDGLRKESMSAAFDKRLKLNEGEFLVQFIVDQEYLSLPYIHIRKERNGRVDYPLIHTAALYLENETRLAVTGLCAFPFRGTKIEYKINDPATFIVDISDKIDELLPSGIKQDHLASSDYRRALFNLALADILDCRGGRIYV